MSNLLENNLELEFNTKLKKLLDEYSTENANACFEFYEGLIWVTIPAKYDENNKCVRDHNEFPLLMLDNQ